MSYNLACQFGVEENSRKSSVLGLAGAPRGKCAILQHPQAHAPDPDKRSGLY